MGESAISTFDWVLAPFYLTIIYFIAANIQRKKILLNPNYKYFLPALFVKIVGAMSLSFIYVYYYKGGDSLGYNSDSSAFLKLLFYAPFDFLKVYFQSFSPEYQYFFTNETGYLIYSNDPNALMVGRLLVPIKLIALNHYLLASIIMGVVSFTGVWKLYEMFCDYYPSMYKYFSLTILFVPSVFFWGSGILKDSWTLAAAGWYCYSFYMVFIKRDKTLLSTLTLLISMFVLISIKPYIFVGLLPGSMLWMIWSRLSKIQNTLMRIVAAPLVVAFGLALGAGILTLTSSSLGRYDSVNSIVEKAHISSIDLKRDAYGGNSFDIGDYEQSLSGIFSKFPIATMTGLFRPFIWETKNIVMYFSGIENLFILGFTIYVLMRKPKSALLNLFSNPIVLFCLIFAVFFAFSVAVSTSNFGALVRLRIPMIPFYLTGLVIILNPKGKLIT